MTGPVTVANALRLASAMLGGARILDPRRDARLLLSIALAMEPLDLMTRSSRDITQGEWTAAQRLLDRRLAGEPVSRIAGSRGFWSLDLAISPAVLDPRPETELLVERPLADVAKRRDEPLRILDLGTGSGCILLALLAELPGAVGVGIDASPAALAIARSNAKACGLAGRVLWVAGDWVKPIRGDYDIIVSNPPYIPSGALATLDLGVRGHDPTAALDGGPDGMAAYRLLIPAMADLLAPAGIACLEVGHGQAPFVAEMASHLGYATEICTDLAGIQRCITLKL